MNQEQRPSLQARIDFRKQQLAEKWKQYERFAPATFFTGGFLFDVLTIERVDSTLQIIQQAVFILLTGAILTLMALDESRGLRIPDRLQKLWRFRVEALHFFVGGLLSAFTLFFIKSSSFFSSAIFLLIIITILVANEFSRIQNMGLPFKFALFSLCLVCYLAYLVPTLTGFIGFGPLLIVIGACGVIIFSMAHLYISWGIEKARVTTLVLRPGLLVLLVFVALYAMKLIPPVPLSLKDIGIYHKVDRTPEGSYKVYFEKPWWKFWHQGDENFVAQPEDRIYTFVRIFSPTDFDDQVQLHWLRENKNGEWQTQDKIRLDILGGRAEGFRGYAYKANYLEGEWLLKVETLEGREIGRIDFEVTKVEDVSPRQFKVETY